MEHIHRKPLHIVQFDDNLFKLNYFWNHNKDNLIH